jgi:hypothetical protein
VAELARTRFNLVPKIVFGQQTRRNQRSGTTNVLGKGIKTESELKRCFPWFRSISFGFGNSERYSEMKRLQTDLMSETLNRNNVTLTTLIGLDSHYIEDVWSSMESLAEIVSSMNGTLKNHSISRTSSLSSNSTHFVPALPLVDIRKMSPFFGQFHESIRRIFTFDDEKCCSLLPDADETVFVRRDSLVIFQQETRPSLTLSYPRGNIALSQLFGRDAQKGEAPGISRNEPIQGRT